MKFDDLDARMRVFETAHDHSVLPGVFMVARIDGRNFTRLTKELHAFEAPFDKRFRDLMLGAVRRLMDCGFRAVYGYTQSDEISLLLHRDESSFDRKLRKFDSILAAEATAALKRLSVTDKNELLFAHGINFNDLPLWQKRGSGVWWESFDKPGVDGRTGAAVTTVRRRLRIELELPMRDDYDAFVRDRITQATA